MHCSPPGSRYEIPDTQMADEKQLEILQDKANFRSFKPKPFNMREFYDRAGHDIRDMLLSCHFRGEVCSAEDFKVVSDALMWGMRQPDPQRRRRPQEQAGFSSCLLLWERNLCVPGVCFWQEGTLFSTGALLLCVMA